MSSKLLEYFLHDDIESFRRLLANAGYPVGGQWSGGNTTDGLGATLGSSPVLSSKSNKKFSGTSPGTSLSERGNVKRGNSTLSREQVNARDRYGRTILHLVSSSLKPSAVEFAEALLEIPFIDIYAQDHESGWTALHRALYAGNAAIAQALLARDLRDATDFSTVGNVHYPSGGLIKIKDREGYSPFDVYGSTIVSRNIKEIVNRTGVLEDSTGVDVPDSDLSSADGHSVPGDDNAEETSYHQRAILKPRTNLQGDEIFTFGSNKNLSLGLGDEDDRQFPERISVQRPEHLLQRFFREYEESRSQDASFDMQTFSHIPDLPTLIRNKPISFQDVVMSKLHTAVLTNDPESNLFMSGFGPGGRLGTGDESTRFGFVCIETGALAGKKIVSVALGQDHSLAISEHGEIFSWGSNKYGQLGYNLPRTNNKDDVPIQTTPRQIFNPFKKEVILGAAASSIHSVVFSTSGLYTFGKNEGQLGIVDSDARSLETQVTPRRVGVSLFNSPIHTVTAIDRATVVLLESHDVWVFTQYGYSKLVFPLDAASTFIKNSFLATRYDTAINRIVKITSGGDTICALSSFGEVYTVQVDKKADTSSVAASTTNPAKIRNSLPPPVRVWSVRKSHMAARDVATGQDGSIIICTKSGSAWKKEKRAKVKTSGSKDYKFVRIPGLFRVVAIRSNAFGSFAAAQRDSDVTKEQISVDESALWDDVSRLLPFATLGLEIEGPSSENTTFIEGLVPRIKRAVLMSQDIESHIQPALQASNLNDNPHGTVWITSTVSDIRVPIHEFIAAGRSLVLREALQEFRMKYYFSIPDVFSIEYGKDGEIEIKFQGVDLLTVLNLVFFLYTDSVLDVWHDIKHSPEKAFRYRQVRTEVMRVATHLELRTLERAARVMIEPTRTLDMDMESSIKDPSLFESADVAVQLDGGEVKLHSQIACQRCPFFDGLFNGRSGGRWLSSRRGSPEEWISVDLKDIDPTVFAFVLRHIYADTSDHLFDDVRSKSLDDFIDLILDVMSAANELMMDRLAQICQQMLGRFINTRNVCHLLNAVAPCSVTEFKDAALEYICLNLESMLLDDLDEDLVYELDAVCQENQLACYPVSRGRNSEDFLYEKYPELVNLVESDRQRRIDSMKLSSRLDRTELNEKFKIGSLDKTASPLAQKTKPSVTKEPKATMASPILKAKQSTGDLMFQMDDESTASPTLSGKGKAVVRDIPLPTNDRQYPESPSSALHPRFMDSGSPGENGSLDDRAGSLSQISITPKRFSASPSVADRSASKAPWASPVISTSKKDLKDIMAEASQSRVSNLTLGMSDRRDPTAGGSTPSKLSQRERKRLQQQQIQEQLAAEQRAKENPHVPWKTPTKPKAPVISETSPRAEAAKAAQRPSMTLRQTVAGTPPSKPGPSPEQGQGRSVSTPLPTPPKPAKPVQTTPGPAASPNLATPAKPAIHSIRHSPRPEPSHASFHSPSSGQLSLASILLQQQTEKDELHEIATAKHNLEDIQLEQEFQEWWDKESKRVMEEEAAAAARENRGKGGRARGSSNRRGRGKGPAPAGDALRTNGQQRKEQGSIETPEKTNKSQGRTPNGKQKDPAAGSNAHRGGRGGNRGRGKARAQPT
ncbi:BTB domain and ankyrin repeat protein [Paecilomyces variotii No. 5]|uniref:BTB domain and ankyrin repeat protein n=1 Tax=Byssochlamys spectabilis (strain No. 5 / NBRC 109023) TaxID=1356009 RepID=V5I0P8_BYSSN|nr:BTB domain and ankyrin repeat protein [Paecilomyces variotii No. 5]